MKSEIEKKDREAPRAADEEARQDLLDFYGAKELALEMRTNRFLGQMCGIKQRCLVKYVTFARTCSPQP